MKTVLLLSCLLLICSTSSSDEINNSNDTESISNSTITSPSSITIQSYPIKGQASQLISEEEGNINTLLQNYGIIQGSFFSILLSELGDKTFIITAILSSKHNKSWVFLGAYGALFLMTFISCFLGRFSEQLLPAAYIKIFSTALFYGFGTKSIYQAIYNQFSDDSSEIGEDLQQLEVKINSKMNSKNKNSNQGEKDSLVQGMQIAFLTFIQNFCGEWGDKSQLSTIAMSASLDFLKVFIGSALGHAICSLLAVTGGKLLADKISERTLTFLGGILFLTYGSVTIYENL